MTELSTRTTYKRLIFDADNTLFDFDRAEEIALVNSLRHHELPVPEGLLDFYRQMNVALWQQLDDKSITLKELKQQRAERLFEFVGQATDHQQFSLFYLQQLAGQPVLLPHVEDTLNQLAPDCEMAIITNGLALVQNARFQRCSIKHHFGALVISEEVGMAKPDPEIFAHTCNLMGWDDPASVLMVGDNYRCDVQGAADFGMATCWFNLRKMSHDFTDHDHEIHRFDELLGVVC